MIAKSSKNYGWWASGPAPLNFMPILCFFMCHALDASDAPQPAFASAGWENEFIPVHWHAVPLCIKLFSRPPAFIVDDMWCNILQSDQPSLSARNRFVVITAQHESWWRVSALTHSRPCCWAIASRDNTFQRNGSLLLNNYRTHLGNSGFRIHQRRESKAT